MSSFNDFLGNQKLKKDVEDMLKNNRFPHSIIIEGQKGLGKGFFAGILTKAIMCQQSATFCNKCSNCRKYDKDIHPDVLVIESGEQKSISVDQIRKIKNSLYIYPNESSTKIYMIKNAQDMTPQAQNALLKMLEEPPKFTVFILTVDKTQKLLDTVVSRCVCFRLEPVSADETMQFLKNIKKNDNLQSFEIAKLSAGNKGRAADASDKKAKDEKFKLMSLEFLKKLCFCGEFEYLNYYKEFYNNKDSIKSILDELIFLLRDLLWYNNYDGENAEYYFKYISEIKELSPLLSNDALINMIDIVEKTKEEIMQNVNFNACISVFQICIREEVYG
jgi:DNA polymerase-3 subunit delta'